MLKELKILNGNLELLFNEYTYEYTVTVEDNISSLDFSYLLEENTYINIRGNNIVNDETIIYIDVYNEEKSITYTFYVYKENNEVFSIDNYISSLEVSKKEETSLFQVELLCCGIFLVIVILFSIIFKRKHN